jgi:PAS domain S-box-containing protein
MREPMMKSELTEQMLALQPGDHLCLFYDKDPAEQMAALVPFIHDGLSKNEQFIYIADDQTVGELSIRLKQSGIDVEKESGRGALKLWTRREWRQPGKLSSARKSSQVTQFVEAARESGFKGIRFAVEMTWSLGPEISAEHLEHWEATLNTLFVPEFPGRIVCQYNRSRLHSRVMLSALRTHPLIILGEDVHPNLFYQAPLILNGNGKGNPEVAQVDWMVSQLKLARAAAKQREGWIRQRSALAEDISNAKRLAEVSQHLAAIVESSDDAIISKDLDGIITSWNQGAARIFGYTAEEVIGKSVTVLIPPDRYNEEPDILGRVRRGERIEHYETVRRCKDGSLVNVSLTVSPIKDGAGKVIGASKIARDISARKRVEQELRKAQDDLAKANSELAKRVYERTAALEQAKAALARDMEEQDRLQEQLRQAQKMESIGTLAGGIAHDFNNILNIIKGYLAVLGQSFSGAGEAADNFKVIDQAIERGASTVRQLLTLARKSEAHLAPTNLNGAVSELNQLLRQTLPKNITMSLQLDPKLPPVMADPGQISQALLNLCVNARDAMPAGGALTLRTTVVHRRSIQDRFTEIMGEWYVCAEVVDTGEGMEANVRSRIFEPFFTTKATGAGTGLGLSVVYAIIKSHNGFIDVESSPGEGTTFRLYFPIAISEKEAVSEKESTIEERNTRESSELQETNGRRTILIAEDESNMAHLLRRVLSQQGYTVLIATDGEEAIELYHRAKERIDVVLLDIGLPKIAGWDVIRKLKEEKPDLSIVVTSGYIEPELKTKMFQAGVKAVVYKPYAITAIVETLQSVLQGDAVRSEANQARVGPGT